jgi:hypothetical protein
MYYSCIARLTTHSKIHKIAIMSTTGIIPANRQINPKMAAFLPQKRKINPSPTTKMIRIEPIINLIFVWFM